MAAGSRKAPDTMAHYVMVGEGKYPVAPIGEAPQLPGGPWYGGKPLKIAVPNPLRYLLESDREDPGMLKALYDEQAIPLMRADLVEALAAAGVNNLELFPAVIEDPMNGERHTNYQAFNVLGLVAAADLAASRTMGTGSSTRLGTDFDSLVLDEGKARDLLLFRLAESCSAIVVHERVKLEIERRKIPGIIFYESGQWSG
jgi:hypothetical protein